MKRFLMIVVISLLFSGNVHSDEKFQGAFICSRADSDLVRYPIIIDEVNNTAKWGLFDVGLKVSFDKFVLVKHTKDLNLIDTFTIDRFNGKFQIKGVNLENGNEWEYFGTCKSKKRKF